jgi:hypothetical protein
LSFATTVPSRSWYCASAIRSLASVVLVDSQAVQFPKSPAVDAALVQMASAPARPPRSPLELPLVTNTWVTGPGGGVAVGVGPIPARAGATAINVRPMATGIVLIKIVERCIFSPVCPGLRAVVDS